MGNTIVSIEVDGLIADVNCVVMGHLIEGVDAILGMDFIQLAGGLEWKHGKVRFLSVRDREDGRQLKLDRKARAAVSQANPVPMLTVKDKDFEARFDGKSWTVRWHWRDRQPPVLINEVDCYRSAKTEQVKEKLEEEVKTWIKRGWMKRCEDQSNGKGILPLLAVVQVNKDKMTVSFTPSEKNRADALTRVPKAWLGEVASVASVVDIQDLQSKHHFGVDRTLYLTRLVDPSVKRECVESVVRSCRQCQTIDPAPSNHVPGEISVPENWARLALDLTHFQGRAYLTVVDCGPSRFAVWREVASENAREICGHMTQIFLERGPPDEVLMDNSTAFRSHQFAEACREWNITRRFRAAYRPSGNGIAERMHRTIKSMAARSGMRWADGKVTGITSENTIEVDGVPRHVLDVRRLFLDGESDEEHTDEPDDVIAQEVQEAPRRSELTRRPPAWLSDYEC
ncbi:hypothetical protein Pcinc_008865 [Petrolisthes cinctipes]|uniref:Integrase catalytic domain-containing protein n=1 Tax=Petrolisthes cinctipes TaxID=88211 RepID=A0AAE1GCB8_PETCI|nr:hypothetical protein Pcinc_020582 [Petrolisthes cinctipes]KAK3886983.1 hypothetical protein Pcinc_008865 [Petrolisthes cinctipes]